MKSNNIEFETIRSNKHRILFFGGVVCVVVLLVALVLNFTRAKYRTIQSLPLINGTVNYSLADLNIVAITVDGESVDTIPDGNYALLDTSYCEVDGEEDESVSLSYDMESQTLTVVPFTTKGTKCYLNFETATTKTVDTPLGEIEVNLDTPDFSKTSCSSGCDEATVGIYETTDNDGTVYYYRGSVDNNWVYFAGYYWRIIRFNGDGTIRLIYNGTTNSQTGSSTQIGTSTFNDDYNRSYYVGLSYSTTQHETGTESTILGKLNDWYDGLSSTNQNYIDSNAGFCSDRNMASGYTWSAKPSSTIYYAVYGRLVDSKSPSLDCSSSDILNIPVGLITADEVAYAGGVATNSSYYLYTGQNYWTMSPSYFSGSYAYVFRVYSSGVLDFDGCADWTNGIRPVINLRANTHFTGTGTSTDPYTVV